MGEEETGATEETSTEVLKSATEEIEDKGSVPLDSVLARTDVQAEIDRRVSSAHAKWESTKVERDAEIKEAAVKEAAEQKLLEDGELEKLLKIREKEAKEATSTLERYRRTEKVNKLLDKHKITDPGLRKLFINQNGELEQLDATMVSFNDMFQTALESKVNERIATSKPPKKPGKSESTGTLLQQIETAEAKGDFETSLALKNQYEELKRKSMVGQSFFPTEFMGAEIAGPDTLSPVVAETK